MGKKGFRTGIVGQLVGLTYKRIEYYDRNGIIQPEIQKAAGRGSRRLYSRANLIELLVLKRLLERGLSLRKVRVSLREARSRYPSLQHPLHDLAFRTDGYSIYVNDPDGGTVIDLLHPEQPVITIAIKNVARQVDSAITEFENHRIETLRVKGRTYLVEIVNDTEFRGCVARCPDLLGVSVKGADVEEALGKLKTRIIEALDQLRPVGTEPPGAKKSGKGGKAAKKS